MGDVALAVDALDVEYGDRVVVEMTNQSDTELTTGNKTKYTLQVLTEDGWMDVRVSPSGTQVGYEDDAIVHSPGCGFVWTFEMTETGIEAAPTHDDSLVVCPDLRDGRYRFVYWSLFEDASVAVAFDLSR